MQFDDTGRTCIAFFCVRWSKQQNKTATLQSASHTCTQHRSSAEAQIRRNSKRCSPSSSVCESRYQVAGTGTTILVRAF